MIDVSTIQKEIDRLIEENKEEAEIKAQYGDTVRQYFEARVDILNELKHWMEINL